MLKLDRIQIRNYKSIQKLDIHLSNFNPFVGKNNVGKSNILSAINLVFTPPVQLEDNSYNSNNQIEIRTTFECDAKNDEEFIKDNKTYLKKDTNCIEIILKSDKGKNLEKYYHNGIEEIKFSNNWSKLIESLPSVVYINAEEILRDTTKVEVKNPFGILIKELTKNIDFFTCYDSIIKSALSVSKQDAAMIQLSEQINTEFRSFSEDIKLKLDLPTPKLKDSLKKIGIYTDDGIPILDLGVGFHRLTILAILKASNLINKKKSDKVILLIDEPEIFLHPTLQFVMYNTLKKYSKSSQVIFSTHNSNFVKISDLKNICLVKKQDRGTTVSYYKGNSLPDNYFESLKVNDGLFADKVILVEGQTELISLPLLYKHEFKESHLLKGCIFIDCQGKPRIKNIIRFFKEFDIPVYVIFDQDLNAKKEALKVAKKTNEGIFSEFHIKSTNETFENEFCTAFKTDYDCVSGISKNNIVNDTKLICDGKKRPEIKQLLERLKNFIGT